MIGDEQGGSLRYFPIIFDGETGIMFGDIARVACAAAGLILLCLLIYGCVAARYSGFYLWALAFGLFAFTASLSELGRLGDGVSVRLPLSTAALLLAVVGMAKAPSVRSPVSRGEWLEKGDPSS